VEAIIAYLVLLFVAATLWSFILVTRAADKRRGSMASAWSRYAARHGYEFAGGTTLERAFTIRGVRGGISFTLSTYARERIVTRLVAPAPFPLEGRVVAALGQARGRDANTPEAATGDAHFDRLFDVHASVPTAAGAVLGPDVRRALQRFPAPMMGQGLRLVF
jgi:hypothetical protein